MDLLDDSHSQDALDFPVVYASGKPAASLEQPPDGQLPDGTDLEPLFRTILETIPAPTYDDEALQAHVTNLDASPFLGRLALLRIRQGNLRKGQTVAWMRATGRSRTSRSPSSGHRGPRAQAGRVRRAGRHRPVAGIPEITIGETLADARTRSRSRSSTSTSPRSR